MCVECGRSLGRARRGRRRLLTWGCVLANGLLGARDGSRRLRHNARNHWGYRRRRNARYRRERGRNPRSGGRVARRRSWLRKGRSFEVRATGRGCWRVASGRGTRGGRPREDKASARRRIQDCHLTCSRHYTTRAWRNAAILAEFVSCQTQGGEPIFCAYGHFARVFGRVQRRH